MFTITIFIVVLGTLVFVHELGHFAAAKACGIYVDRFSLGIPPRVAGFRWGETDYCIGALPLGGYVKMAGQEDAPLSDEEREQAYGHVPPERWFNNKPVWQRTIVIIAGPAMNLLFGVFVFGVWAAVGGEFPENQMTDRIGYVLPESPAASAQLYAIEEPGERVDFSGEPAAVGLQAGDRIASLNGERIDAVLTDVRIEAILGKDKIHRFEILRPNPDGTETRLAAMIQPEILEGEQYPAFGIQPFATGLVRFSVEDSPAEKIGIQSGDIIRRANGTIVDSVTFSALLDQTPPGESVEIEIERDGEIIAKTIAPATVGQFENILFVPPIHGFVENEIVVHKSASPGFREETGLRKGDEILAIDGAAPNGERVQEWLRSDAQGPYQVKVERGPWLFGFIGGGKVETVELTLDEILWAATGYNQNHPVEVEYIAPDLAEETGIQRKDIVTQVNGNPATPAEMRRQREENVGETVPIAVKRPAYGLGAIQQEKIFETELPVSAVQQIGVVWDTKFVFHRVPRSQIVPEAFRQTELALNQMVRIVAQLFTGGVSPKELAGPVGIADMTASVARRSWTMLLEWTAFLSINLCIVNLIPLPVLDGGQLVFLGIEAVRRKPVNQRVFEVVQQMGLLMIIALVLFVTYNDIDRLLTRYLPGW